MNPHSATLLRALATLHVAEVRFTITRDGDALHHSMPKARTEGPRVLDRSFPVLSVEELFEAYALTPRKGVYTLRVADGQLSYETAPARKTVRTTGPGKKISRHRHAFARRHEKLAA